MWRVLQDPLCPVGGRAIRGLLLERGSRGASPQQAVMDLLGDAHALRPLAGEHRAGAGGSGAGSEGWVPDLGSDAWQDIDLLR